MVTDRFKKHGQIGFESIGRKHDKLEVTALNSRNYKRRNKENV
jgi:hypothetical protein